MRRLLFFGLIQALFGKLTSMFIPSVSRSRWLKRRAPGFPKSAIVAGQRELAKPSLDTRSTPDHEATSGVEIVEGDYLAKVGTEDGFDSHLFHARVGGQQGIHGWILDSTAGDSFEPTFT
jgi:hypothetical protein